MSLRWKSCGDEHLWRDDPRCSYCWREVAIGAYEKRGCTGTHRRIGYKSCGDVDVGLLLLVAPPPPAAPPALHCLTLVASLLNGDHSWILRQQGSLIGGLTRSSVGIVQHGRREVLDLYEFAPTS